MTAITLTYPVVLAAARLAYEEGRLSAQGPKPACLYEDTTGRPCAVGAALQPGAISKADQCESVTTLRQRGIFQISREDFPKIKALQGAHDEWARGTGTGTEADFKELIA
jgi:hypothetical protein